MRTPQDKDLFKIQQSPKLLKVDQKLFHSTVMRILYYASRVWPDLLCTATCLTMRTRLGTASEDDKNRLLYVLHFIHTTQHDGIILGGESHGVLRLRVYADASYGVHMDGKSHTGIVITLGRGLIYCKSSKQKPATKSSCKAEILALSDIIPTVTWIRDFITIF